MSATPSQPALHAGKLNKRVETSLTEAMDDWIAQKAHSMDMREADLIRELIFKGATGEIYSVHVANDRAAAFGQQPAKVRESNRNDLA